MGKALGGGSTKAKPAQPYKAAQFQPYTYTNQVGTTEGRPEGESGYNVSSNIDSSLTSLGQTGLSAAEPFLQKYLREANRPVSGFGFSDDTRQRETDIYNQQAALLQPSFQQQNQQLQNTLFGSGRMGLQLAGESVGAGGGNGFVQPDAFGLGRAQSLTLADLAGKARGVAQQEQQQQFSQNVQGYGLNQAAQQEQMANSFAGFQGGLGAFGGVLDMEQALVSAGLSIEQARSASQAASASGGAALAQAGQKASSGGGAFSAIAGGLGQSIGKTDWGQVAKSGAEMYLKSQVPVG
tara:strand:+ start:470 stop:1354 length:885 start_codon:yes stop_codon:yes gene_type:complete